MRKRGFSLIELLVVVAIVAMLVGVAAPYYSDYLRESKLSKAKADLDVLKQSIVLYNSREDIPYRGPIASQPPYLPVLGENDFSGLMGRFLTTIPMDPWGKNYKLDPYAGFVYSDGPDSLTDADNVREYFIKELALSRAEWLDVNGDRLMNNPDKLYFQFNKPLWVQSMVSTDFDVFENNQIATGVVLSFTYDGVGNPTSEDLATSSTLVCTVNNGNTVRVGVHAIAFRDDINTVLSRYQEVVYDRARSTPQIIYTKVEKINNNPLRYIIRTNPLKIIPKA
jgi:prepilin-type N-terminal cleavage/methylation domain-containing protein